MGISIQYCSCLRNPKDEKISEFQPQLNDNNPENKKKNKNILEFYPISTTVNSVNTEEKEKEKFFESKQFSFKASYSNDTLSKQDIIKIQAVFRGYIYRKKFKNKIKQNLIQDSEKFIKEKEKEFIPENLLKTDLILKKEFNEEFLSKLDLKENNKSIKFKTKCLIKKTNLKDEYSLYRGEIDLKGYYNGYGELYIKTGKKYEGKFTNNKLNGYGRLIDLFGIKCYEGIFKDDKLMDSKGKIISFKEDNNNIVYKGDIKNMKKEGKGIEEKKNEYTYMGSFKNDLYEGNGKIIFDKNEFYEGDFLKGKITGNGYYKWKDKTSYEGEFLDGKMHGKGIYKWPDGSEFEGNYSNNLKEGYGEYRWTNGKIYQGMYKNGVKHGKGVYIKKNGQKKEVMYNKGELVKNYVKEYENNDNDILSIYSYKENNNFSSGE